VANLSIKSETQNSVIDCFGPWDGECVCRCQNADGSIFLAWHDSRTDKTWADVVASVTADYFGGFKIFQLWEISAYRAQKQYLAGDL